MESPFLGTEALRAGIVTERELRRSCQRIYRDVYLRRGADIDARSRAVAAWLWSGRRGIVAGNSAAALHGAKWVDGVAPAELVSSRKRPPPLIIARNDVLLPGEVSAVNGIPVTSPERTAFDLGRRPGLHAAVARMDALARATGLAVDDVARLAELHRGVRGIRQLRQALLLVDAGAESPQETRTRLLVIAAGLPPPQTQIEVLNDWGRVLARIDMGWPEVKVGIEYDVSQHWTDPRVRTNDIDRAAELQRRSWILIRVSADLLRYRPDVVIARVREALRSRGMPV